MENQNETTAFDLMKKTERETLDKVAIQLCPEIFIDEDEMPTEEDMYKSGYEATFIAGYSLAMQKVAEKLQKLTNKNDGKEKTN